MEPYELTAYDAWVAIQQGSLSPIELAQSCLDRIASTDERILAWSYVCSNDALARAKQLSHSSKDGTLFGMPYGVKDVIDTASCPTQYNSPLYEGFQPAKDAAAVSLLDGQGGVLLGKTDTVEFASLGRNAKSHNPHRLGFTPGGSSSGSAAAVAAGMVPLALGTQTGGSTIRPAAYCGIFGMKPTFGRVSTEGMREYAPSLDTLGWMGRSVEDLALIAQAYGLSTTATPSSPGALRIGFLKTPYWDEADECVKSALANACTTLSKSGVSIQDIEEGDILRDLNHHQDVIMHGEGRAAYLPEYREHRERLHPRLIDEVENAKGITVEDMRNAYDIIGEARPKFDALFDTIDVCLTASVPGEAPEGLGETGSATFNRLFTALHVPCVTMPYGTGPKGLPLGIQVIGKRYEDEKLLATARKVTELLDATWKRPTL